MELTIQNVLNKISDVNQETELEKKLEDINLPLTEYLNHPDAIQCFQDMKKNAVKYFNSDKIKQLIKYITTLQKTMTYGCIPALLPSHPTSQLPDLPL